MVSPGSLLDDILASDTLRFAWRRVEANAGTPGGDGISLARFALRLDANLIALADDVRAGTYRPGMPRHLSLQIGAKVRDLDVLPVRDRVLQRATLDVLTPRLDPGFLPCSFGYRVGRSLQDAVACIVHLRERGLRWVVDADIADCFASFDHALMTRFAAAVIPDPAVCRLLDLWMATSPRRERPRRRGILLGAPISPLLCNIYLHHLDIGLHLRRFQIVRYADDFVVLCKSEAHAEAGLRATEKVLHGLHLELNHAKTRLVNFDRGFDFLGVHFHGNHYRYEVEGKTIVVDELPPDDFYYEADGYR
ncbi:MAG TPA: reverse transcriptase domain-containing protein [Dehalococcoidia bacterium]|nr:reverse transcriptase domain-containing protein [Dehalococcoidia bacterium]